MEDSFMTPVEDVMAAAAGSYLKSVKTHTLTSAMQLLGFDILKPQQVEVVDASLSKRDCLVIMPTGSGKSACFLLPGLVELGITIVISPLKSLMFDQLNYLKSIGIKASIGCVESDVNSHNFFASLTQHSPDVKFLFFTPEKLVNALIEAGDRNKLRKLLVVLSRKGFLLRFVVDEAHCICLWGTEFRVEYGMLGVIRKCFPNVPIMALTGTANLETQTKICNSLLLQHPYTSKSSCVRVNLKMEVIDKSSFSKNLQILIKLICSSHKYDCGIVYCSSRSECDSLARHLVNSGYSAAPYHAGMTDTERDACQDNWMFGRCQIMCATNAFGMGVNKPNVRFICHLTMPSTISSFYQECGRAGRDGSIASCYLFYQFSDHCYLQHLINGKTNMETRNTESRDLWEMVRFCANKFDCRNRMIAEHLGEKNITCERDGHVLCDNCTAKNVEAKLFVQQEVDCIRNLFEVCPAVIFTVTKLLDVFLSEQKKKSFPNDWKRRNAKLLIHRLIIDKVLEEEIEITQFTDYTGKTAVRKCYASLRLGSNWPIFEYSVSLIEPSVAHKSKKPRLEQNSDSDFED